MVLSLDFLSILSVCLKNGKARQLKIYIVLKFGFYVDNGSQPGGVCVCQRMEGLSSIKLPFWFCSICINPTLSLRFVFIILPFSFSLHCTHLGVRILPGSYNLSTSMHLQKKILERVQLTESSKNVFSLQGGCAGPSFYSIPKLQHGRANKPIHKQDIVMK